MRAAAALVLTLLSSCIAWPDRQWERLQAKHPALYQVDNRPWKTWGWHSAITVAGGHAIAACTPADPATGMRIMVATYLLRESLNLYLDRQRQRLSRDRYFDATMDVALPLSVSEIWSWLAR